MEEASEGGLEARRAAVVVQIAPSAAPVQGIQLLFENPPDLWSQLRVVDGSESASSHPALDLLEGVGRVDQELDGDVSGGEGYGAERAVGGCSHQRSRARSERDRVVPTIPWIDHLIIPEALSPGIACPTTASPHRRR